MRYFFIILAILFAPQQALTQEPPRSERLEEINSKVSALQEEQKILTASMQANEKALTKLNQEIVTVRENLQSNTIELASLKDSVVSLTSEIDDYTQRYKDMEQQSAARLRAFYMLGGGAQMAVKVSSEGKAGISQISHYMNALRSHEVASIAELQRLSSEKALRVEQVKSKTLELQNINKMIEAQRDELKSKQQQLESANQTLKKQKASKTKIISELRAESLRLETVLSSLVEDSSTLATGNIGTGKVSLGPLDNQIEGHSGDGLAAKFSAPIPGQVVSKFGSLISDGLDQKIISKGIGFIAPEGREVVAVGAGKVSFAGVLGTYGNVVIVDHGSRVYTLYSLLASISVSLGQAINLGDVLGNVGAVLSPKSFNLYFELRKEGLAVDPKPFMK